MSTRAVVALKLPDQTVVATYLHFDGYPDHVLPILETGYLDPDEALELIEGGELRSISPRPAEPEYFATSRPTERLQSADELPGLARYLNAGHIYYYGDKRWMHQKL
ncbi:hypothetical protein [Crateriforma conspicua]|uniref:Uncharacterized protein n=1 Tax=Crateriforma conspicua TaxID=2527996 RepID=A0A5C6FKW7_9PLAN|nr:hypothetical protein [Crateriforma conspicua]TWU61954.1 hypothetical protein V7x_36450 [Crateriforma conspicua]